ncbi:MAG TPA: SurA N-terminal domain-containing protein [Vineibacter sp.]|nr:SurA N-terminal domain-containing protein [Vineibacter sp.]
MRQFCALRALAALVIVSAACSAVAAPARAQGTCVAAIVNDLSITSLEVNQRTRFALMASRTADTADSRDRTSRQMLNNMIDERLQLAEAKRTGISVSKQEIDERVQQIEQSNGIPTGGLEQGLRGAGIPISVLRNQLEANIAWSKLLLRKVRGTITVTDAEVDDAIRQARAAGGKPEGRGGGTSDARLNMVQLLLPLPNNASAEEVERQKGVAQGIISQAKSCTELRRACGKTKGCTSSDSDGVSIGALPPAIAEAARGAAIGQGLGPYQAGTNMQIVAICSREGDGGGPSREAVERRLQSVKLEAAAQRYMREIRRNAVIDIRSNCKI